MDTDEAREVSSSNIGPYQWSNPSNISYQICRMEFSWRDLWKSWMWGIQDRQKGSTIIHSSWWNLQGIGMAATGFKGHWTNSWRTVLSVTTDHVGCMYYLPEQRHHDSECQSLGNMRVLVGRTYRHLAGQWDQDAGLEGPLNWSDRAGLMFLFSQVTPDTLSVELTHLSLE